MRMDLGSATKTWRQRVEAHHEQSVRAQGEGYTEDDFWRPFISFFRVDYKRTDDPMLTRLKREVQPSSTILDVGGGAGRYALPLALVSEHVTVIEPSYSMLEGLREGIIQAGIKNIETIHTSWEEADVESADLLLCAHVLYGVANVEGFLTKVQAHARQKVLLVILVNSPQSHLSQLWERVHGEPRINLPGLKELTCVLWEMGIFPNIEMIDGGGPYTYETRNQAREEIRRRLYVAPNSRKEMDLDMALAESFLHTDGGFVVCGTSFRQLALVSWQPT